MQPTNNVNVETARAVQFLATDPSFWDAIRSSWLVDHTWRPRIDAWAVLGGKKVLTIAKSTAPDSFEVQGLDGVRLTARADQLSQAPYVPWAVVRMHATPKLAIAGVNAKRVDWDEVCDRLHQDNDPAQCVAEQDGEQDECAANTPRN